MAMIFLSNSLSLYLKNFKTALAFAILLVSVLIFNYFQNIFISSGSIFLSYSLSSAGLVGLIIPLITVLVFLLFYSFFITVIVFSVRKELSTVKMNYYLTEALRKFAFKLFAFFAVSAVIVYFLQLGLDFLGVPFWALSLLVLILSLLVMFVPQAMVIDEEPFFSSIAENLYFMRKNPKSVFFVLVVGMVMLALLQLVEFSLDRFVLAGNYFTLVVSIVFIVPFMEILKTYLYMVDKFGLIWGHEIKRVTTKSRAAA